MLELCNGHGCLLKEVCYSYKAKPEDNQKYFKAPIKVTWQATGINKGRWFYCPNFWVLYEDRNQWIALSDQIDQEDRIALKQNRSL